MVAPVVAIFGVGVVAAIVKKVFFAAGVAVVTFTGGQAVILAVGTAAEALLGSVGPEVMPIIGLARIDDAIAVQLMFANMRLVIAGTKKFAPK